jgi:hypothetical protein
MKAQYFEQESADVDDIFYKWLKVKVMSLKHVY